MKLFGLFMVMFMVMATAITVNGQSYDVKFDRNDMYRTAPAFDSDTVSGTETVSKVFFVNKDNAYTFTWEFDIDTLAADSIAYFYVDGSYNGVKYYPIDTITYSLTADTVGAINWSTSVRYRYLRGKLAGTKAGQKMQLGKQGLILSY